MMRAGVKKENRSELLEVMIGFAYDAVPMTLEWRQAALYLIITTVLKEFEFVTFVLVFCHLRGGAHALITSVPLYSTPPRNGYLAHQICAKTHPSRSDGSGIAIETDDQWKNKTPSDSLTSHLSRKKRHMR